MNKFNLSIVENIQSNRYFVDSRHWYMTKYISPVVERCYVLLLAFIFVTAAVAELIFVNNLYVENIRFVVPMTLDDTIDFQPVIKELNSSTATNNDPYKVISEYLVSNYVKILTT
jgi:type IV secretory pathway component VirB8